jgi:hypothetical protein
MIVWVGIWLVASCWMWLELLYPGCGLVGAGWMAGPILVAGDRWQVPDDQQAVGWLAGAG